MSSVRPEICSQKLIFGRYYSILASKSLKLLNIRDLIVQYEPNGAI